MKIKTKLIASIMSICLVCAVFAIGVFALKTANLKIGGDVSFQATGVEAHIRNASLSGLSTTNQDIAANDAEGEYINTSMTQSAIDTTFATWQNLTLDFNENADDIVFKFDIANTSINADNYIEIDYSYSFSNENPNVDVFPGDENDQKVWENNEYILAPKGATPAAGDYETFTLKFRVLDKELNVKADTKVNLTIALKHHTAKSAAATDNVVTIDNVKYTLNSPSAGFATVTGHTIETEGFAAVVHPVVKSNAEGAVPCVVTNIGNGSFEYCVNLKSIAIPTSVTRIGMSAFYECWALTSIIIPSSVISVDSNAFGSCVGLESVTIPTSVISIGTTVFDGTIWYNNLPDGVIYINNIAYSYNNIGVDVVIRDGTTIINDYAFCYNSTLKTITIPSSVTKIGLGSFYCCENLTSAKFENPNGWYFATSADATSGTDVTTLIADFSEVNANVLNDIGEGQYLLRKTA